VVCWQFGSYFRVEAGSHLQQYGMVLPRRKLICQCPERSETAHLMRLACGEPPAEWLYEKTQRKIVQRRTERARRLGDEISVLGAIFSRGHIVVAGLENRSEKLGF